MNKVKYIIFGFAFVFIESLSAQVVQNQANLDSKEKLGATYYTYPTPSANKTKAPKGFQPFYISHYGRHGSRWLNNDQEFYKILKIFRNADEMHALTKKGKQIKEKLEILWQLAEGHNGDLTSLGAKQQMQIAQRMMDNFPVIFKTNASINAISTLVPRCVMSMAYFNNELVRNNPSLDVRMDTSSKYGRFLSYHSEAYWKFGESINLWRIELDKFRESIIDDNRLTQSLFSDEDFVYKNIYPKKFMEDLFKLTVSLQNIETDISFFDLFTEKELFNLYQGMNYRMYLRDGPSTADGGIALNDAKPLLSKILEDALEKIEGGKKSVDLRFGHDGHLIPLLALLKVENSYTEVSDPHKVHEVWNAYEVSPMAANLQIIFYKNKSDNILVKFLHNEEEVSIPIKTDRFPYYSWNNVKNYIGEVLN